MRVPTERLQTLGSKTSGLCNHRPNMSRVTSEQALSLLPSICTRMTPVLRLLLAFLDGLRFIRRHTKYCARRLGLFLTFLGRKLTVWRWFLGKRCISRGPEPTGFPPAPASLFDYSSQSPNPPHSLDGRNFVNRSSGNLSTLSTQSRADDRAPAYSPPADLHDESSQHFPIISSPTPGYSLPEGRFVHLINSDQVPRYTKDITMQVDYTIV